jgi:hypothetical protein
MREDAELKQFRDLMPPPNHWEEGFGLKAMIGAIFVGMIMTPASMYMNLVVGSDIGSAAQWVTVILFLEVARRSFTVLTRAEIYVLYYMAGASMVSGTGLLWNQFMVQSDAFRQFGLTNYVPPWVAPTNPDVLGQRSFFQPAWMVPIGLTALGMALQRLDQFGLGYVMYRLTSDVEKLPFPMAPVGAQGITALADASGGKETWRWRVFSFGAMLGMVFSAVYLALPAVSGAFLPEPISIFPLPFKDLTSNTETFLPAFPFMLSFDLGLILSGMILPFWAIVGSTIGLIACVLACPVLFKTGVLAHWKPGVGALTTINSNYMDFFFSFGLGLLGAIAVVGIYNVVRALLTKNKELDEAGAPQVDWKALFHPPAGRGDFSLWIGVAIYLFSMTWAIGATYVMLTWAANHGMGSPVTTTLMAVLIFYGFIYTPIMSYISARMTGIVGMDVQLPFVKEATFILTGYKGAAIWFTPFPVFNYGWQTLYFRTTELTGTKIRSMVKAEAFIFPIVLIATLVFSQFIWRIAPVPSSAFPFADKMWEMGAFRQALVYSSTMPGGASGPFMEAFNVTYLLIGLGLALLLFSSLSWFGLPILLVYGVIRGLDQSTPHVILPQLIGALLGRYYFAKRFGDNWPQYRVVFFAGYGCGVGLVMMFSLGLVFMSKSVFQATF